MRNIFAKLAGVMAIGMGALLVGAAPAAAAPIDTQSCSFDPYLFPFTSFNDCIFIGNYNDGDWRIVVGLDLTVTPQHAQQGILNCPANFSAELWGADASGAAGMQTSPPSGEDDFLTWLPITVGPNITTDEFGTTMLGVGFEKSVNFRVLNEDNGTDEIYVLIRFTDCSAGTRQIMLRTNEISHNF